MTIQVLPTVAHPANASGFLIADDAVWCEHVVGGYVFTDAQIVFECDNRLAEPDAPPWTAYGGDTRARRRRALLG